MDQPSSSFHIQLTFNKYLQKKKRERERRKEWKREELRETRRKRERKGEKPYYLVINLLIANFIF